MDLFSELENMADIAAYAEPEDDSSSHECDPNHATIKMWQDRFGYTYDEAAALLDITNSKSVTKVPVATAQPSERMLSPAQARTIYLLKLDGPLCTPAKVQVAGKLERIPECHVGSRDDNGSASASVFCAVDGRGKREIEGWLAAKANLNSKDVNFRPLFIRLGMAYKELSSTSLYPTLGVDTTLPQFRPQDLQLLDSVPSFGRAQEEFPVWYFFYGTLACEERLRELLGLGEGEEVVLREAWVRGGRMERWGKYNALVDDFAAAPGRRGVEGWAYRVMCEEDEEKLRRYETDMYEVVRCVIEMNGREVRGCTFRFVGGLE